MKGYISKGCRINKDDLKKFKVDECPQCNHLTLQAQIGGDLWHTCLSCGRVLELRYVVK